MTGQSPQYHRPPQTNGKAVAALVLGILAVVIPYIGIILGIIAIIFGSQAKRAIDQNAEAGRGMATAGFVCGIIGLCLWLLFIILGVVGVVMFSTLVTHHTTVTHTVNIPGF